MALAPAFHLPLKGTQEQAVDKNVKLCNCENMKNITVSVDDQIYRQARIKAAERDTSVSALVRQFLIDITKNEIDTERVKSGQAASHTAGHTANDAVYLKLAEQSFADWNEPEAERAFRDF